MDLLSAIINLLRGKPGNEAVQADQAPQALAAGAQAATDPAYAAYVREAKSMGEQPVAQDVWRQSQGR